MKIHIRIFAIVVLILIVGVEAFFLTMILEEQKILKNQISLVKEERDHFKRSFSESDSMIQSLKVNLKMQKEKTLDFAAKVRELETELSGIKGQIDSLSGNLVMIKDFKQDTEDRLHATLKELDILKTTKQFPIQDELVELKGSLAAKNEELVDLKKKINDLQNSSESLAKANKSLQDKLEGVEPKRKKVYSELKEAKAKLLAQQEKLIAQQRELKDLSSVNKELEEKVGRLSQIVAKKEVELSVLEEERDKLQRDLSELQLKQVDLETQLRKAKLEEERAVKLLNEIAQLNSMAEQMLGEFSKAGQDKEKAEELKRKLTEELKRKVEVILMPQEGL